MSEFKHYHPIVNFLYFAVVIFFSMLFRHPVCLAISLLCSFVYSIILKGRKTLHFNLAFLVPILIIAALINPLFSHEGATVLTYLPSGNPLTMESVAYGVAAASIVISVVCWFSCYNEIMTSDKFIYLFGKIIPALSLVLSMVLRFVPRFKEQFRAIANARLCIGRGTSNGSMLKRAKCGITILSIMITWALENSIETADSMKSRGYGLPGRTAFSIFTFDKRDTKALVCICILSVYIFIGYITSGIYFRYFPTMKSNGFSIYTLSIFSAFFALCIMPVIIELWEEHKWNSIKSKI